MKVIGILQARTSSSRLPGKVLKPLLGTAMLLRQIERLRRAKRMELLVVATTTEPSDDPLADLCCGAGVPVYRGSLEDVLDRFYRATLPYLPEHVVRLTGDCPLADPEIIDHVVDMHIGGDFDYTSNALEPTYPDGLDAEVIRLSALQRAWQEAGLPSQREHVTSYIYQHPEVFRVLSVKQPQNQACLRWTVDEPNDFELVERIYTELYPSNPHFTTTDTLAWLDKNPIFKTWNTDHARNEGYLASLERD